MINIAEIKQLPNPEKIELINLIWDSLEEENGILQVQENDEEYISKRIQAEDDGLLTFDSWVNVKNRIIEKLDNKS